MAERYSKVFLLPPNLYAAGAPVIIAAGALLKDNVTGKMLAQLKLKSISPKPIKAVKVKIFPLDTVNKPLNGEIAYEYLDLTVERDEEFGQKNAIPLPNPSTRALTAEVTDLAYADNTVWVPTGETWEPLPEQSPIKDAELEKQYQIRFGKQARYKAVENRDLWLCSCGAVNRRGEGCHVCGNELSDLLSCDFAALEEEKDQRLASEKAEREAKAAADKAAAEARIKKTKKALSIAAPIVVVCIAFAVLLTTVIIPKRKLNKATALIDAGDYEAAYALLEEIGDRDAIASSKYDRATALIDAGDYEAAYALLEEIGNSDAIASSKYDRAVSLINSGDYEGAYILLDGLNYKDSADRLNSIKAEYRKILLAKAEVGAYVYFGSYEQDNNKTNGKEDIEWLVLAKEGDKALVISRYALDCRLPYNTSYANVTWETCSLRKWLNGTFLNAAFSAEERAMIPSVTVSADKNPSYSTSPGNSTTDQVFLLSITEANKYFSSDEARKCAPTDYAVAQGVCTSDKVDGRAACWWLLRSPGNNSSKAANVNSDGSVDDFGDIVYNDYYAVRPALWVDFGS